LDLVGLDLGTFLVAAVSVRDSGEQREPGGVRNEPCGVTSTRSWNTTVGEVPMPNRSPSGSDPSAGDAQAPMPSARR
jgi:hypothetical protein